jgi:hypothetical protein
MFETFSHKKFAGAEGTKEKVPKGQQSNTKGFPFCEKGYNVWSR